MLRKSQAHAGTIAILMTVLLTSAAWPQPAVAGGLQSIVRSISAAFQKKKPHAAKDATVEELADQIDWLEFTIETYGTIVPKQPDVWGEARLTRHRHEFEQEMFSEFGAFAETLQGAIRRTDQAYFGAAMAISSSAPGNPGGSSSSSSVTGLIGDPNAEGQTIIDRKPPERIDLSNFQTGELSLEPTVLLDQKARYLNHLNEIRRINEGDDITDSPGYALNLVRIPISVLPGKKTREGFGAELTVTADLHLTDDLLPNTFRNLIIEDVVDQLALPITKVLEDQNLIKRLDEVLPNADRVHTAYERLRWLKYHLEAGRDVPDFETIRLLVQQSIEVINEENDGRFDASRRLDAAAETHDVPALLFLLDQLLRGTTGAEDNEKNAIAKFAKSAGVESVQEDFIQVFREWQGRQPLRSRRSPLAYPPSQVHDVFGQNFHVLGHVTLDARRSLGQGPNARVVHMLDIQAFLRTELDAAYKFVTENNSFLLSRHCGPEIVQAIRRRERSSDEMSYNNILDDARIPSIIRLRDAYFNDIVQLFPRAAHTTTVSLGWAIIVESALLNDRLMKDMREVAQGKGCSCFVDESQWADFYLPKPSPTAIETFNEYVRCRWPIHVFALDPITLDQNVADVFSRRRELQLAISVAVANGTMSANAASRFARRLETDIETISLNRTVVGFSHGSDTFGWRFYPRVQSPPIPGTLGAFGQTLFGGPSADADLHRRQLEPAIRECHALVVMPSFVPQITLDTRANWFALTNPSKKMLTMNDTMKLSRSYQAVQSAMQTVCHADAYRPGDVAQLQRVVSHLDRRMPLQNMLVEIPYENTSGGFELFSNGVTDLAPELVGWYGAPGVSLDVDSFQSPAGSTPPIGYDRDYYPLPFHGTTLFLVGNGFSVHDTRVIVGGKCVPYMLLSRQVMEVTIPTNVNTLREDGKLFVDAHVASPYGISSHLLIPAVTKSAEVAPSITALESSLAPMRFRVRPDEKLRFSFTYERVRGELENLRLIATDAGKNVAIEYDERDRLGLEERSELDVLIAFYADDQLIARADTLVSDANHPITRSRGQILVPAELVQKMLATKVGEARLSELTNSYANGNQKSLAFRAVFYLEPTLRNGHVSKTALPVQVEGQLSLELQMQPEPPKAELLPVPLQRPSG